MRPRPSPNQAAASAAVAPATASTGVASETHKTLAGLDCIINSPGGDGAVDMVVIVLHGYGATADNFSPFPALFSRMPNSPLAGKRIGWVFPQAKPDHQGVPAWWEIDVMEWMGAMQQGASSAAGQAVLAKLIRKEFNGMPLCRETMRQLLKEVDQIFPGTGGTLPPVCFGGFSQGAMTAMDATLSAGLPDERVIAVMMLSGAPIVVDQWAPKLKARAGKLKVLVTHGRADPVLPFVGSGWLKDLLESSLGKAAVTYETHGGGHELGGKENDVAKFLGSLLD